MKKKILISLILFCVLQISCFKITRQYTTIRVIQTSSTGDKMKEKGPFSLTSIEKNHLPAVAIFPEERYQKILGFGGAFTESSAYVLDQLSDSSRADVIHRYFSEDGAWYSLTRTHINSCDFSLRSYAYASVPGDTQLVHFDIKEDLDDIIPLIKDAMIIPGADFKIIASPWTAPPWMKDNNAWFGGALKHEYYPAWALYFSKYIKAYKKQNIPVWGVTVENEPLGNGSSWESMIFSPASMADFVKNHLGPRFKKDALNTKILVYDQNRDEVEEWTHTLLGDPEVSPYIWGTAVHWYSSTVDWYPETLNAIHEAYPDKFLIHTEGCIDNIGNDEPEGIWLNDDWYWRREATDWGYVWLEGDDKALHPPYVPVYRYARDLIGGLNSWLIGWIDWNLVLNFQGGPNHVNNFCLAPVLADPSTDSVYYTPLFYVMAHFSKFIRPNAHRIGVNSETGDLMITACRNTDGSIAVMVLNQEENVIQYQLQIKDKTVVLSISGKALQTLVIE